MLRIIRSLEKKIRVGIVDSQPVEKKKWWVFNLRDARGGTTSLYLAKGGNDHPEKLQLGDSIYVLTYFDYPTSPYQRMLIDQERKAKYEKIDNYKQQRAKKKPHKTNRKKTNKKHSYQSTQDSQKSSINKYSEKNDSVFEGFKRYLFYQGVSDVAFASQGAWGFYYENSHVFKRERNDRPWYSDIAGHMNKHYHMAGFSATSEGVIEAMTTGDKTSLSKETKDNFANAGISHVLALSGFHLTIIVAIFDLLLLRGAFKRKWRLITGLAIIPFIWAFTFIVGFPPSLVRASAMCSIIQLAMVIGHYQEMKNACGLAVFVMLLWNPLMVMNVGFQLSFMSIVGIATIGSDLCRWVGMKVGGWKYLTDVVVISLTCTIFTFPLVAYHFGQVPLYSIFSNLFVSIFAVLLMWGAVLWWLFFWWALIRDLLTSLLDWLANVMAYLAEMVANLPLATISFKPNFLVVLFLYAIIALVVKCVQNYMAKSINIAVVKI